MTYHGLLLVGMSQAQPRSAGISVPQIGSAVPIQSRIDDGKGVERGLVADAVEGGA